MNAILKWRVVYGYNPNDYISIDETYLEKAKFAMISGKVFNYKTKTIRGREIKSIEPDYRFYTGWFDSYEIQSGEDQVQIDRDVPMEAIEERSAKADQRVKYILTSGKTQMLNHIGQVDKLLLA